MLHRPFFRLILWLSHQAAPSAPAFLTGALCFMAALSPSLIPRAGIVQGVLAGASFSAGYLIGFMALLLWRIIRLRELQGRVREGATIAAFTTSAVLMGWALSQATGWQDTLHSAMGLAPVESARPLTIAGVALVTAVALVLTGRLFRKAVLLMSHRLAPLMPERLALFLGFIAALFAFDLIGNDVILSQILRTLDSSYEALDATLPTDTAAPEDPARSGSAASLLRWRDLGREGRARILDPLDRAKISAIAGRPAKDPLRVYVGLGSAETPQARAELALAEAIRQGAFERGTLVIATPTGTGWVDPAAMLPLEALTLGDVATISVQYSYLPSWLSLLTVPEYGAETARAVFAAIHGHWRSLPRETRPALYLFGLSLGSLNSDLSADFYDLIADPYQGAFWAGPPFGSRSWRQITDGRQAGTPEWLPRFRDGSVVRFMNQHAIPDAGKPWGPMRILYLQYASDPITFFSPSILWREPDWMKGPRGPGVMEDFRWYPVVTFLQTGFDVITGTTTPTGHGHVYAAGDYLRGWQALMAPEGWDDAGLERLHAEIRARGL